MDSNAEQTIFSSQVLKKRQLNIKTNCIKGNQSNLTCNNTDCEQYAFVCGNRNCQCRVSHKKCLFTCTDQILQLIEDKRAESCEVIDKVSSVLDKWIDEISKTRQKIQDMLLDWGLSGPQKKFIEIIQKEDFKQLTGNHVHQITTQTIGYFSDQTKEKLFQQIERVEENYQAQINAINRAVLSLFEKYQIQQKDIAFKDNIKFQIQADFHFLTQVFNFKNQELQKSGKLKVEDYDKTLKFLKLALRKDFEAHMTKYKRNRRTYGSKKLRQKYFDDYFSVLSKGKQYIQKWQVDTEQNMKHLNKTLEKEMTGLSVFYRQADGLVQKPFTPQMALSLQSTINVIHMVTDFTKTKGKQQLEFLISKDLRLNDHFEVAMYFLDYIMDDHPEIDEIQVVWNIVRFSQKLKDEVSLMFETINQARSEVYNYEIN